MPSFPYLIGVDLGVPGDDRTAVMFQRDSRPIVTVTGTDIVHQFYATECTCEQSMPLEVVSEAGTIHMGCSECHSFINESFIEIGPSWFGFGDMTT